MVSPLGFGSANVGYLGEDAKRTGQILNLLLDSGVNLVDTAACYPTSEELIGQSVSHRRSEFVLVTKCGHQVEGTRGPEWSGELVTESIERSLSRLQTDRIDVVLLHSCDLAVLERGEALEALGRAQTAGKVLCIGYSGDNEAAAYAAGLEEVSILETSISICDQANIEGVLPICREEEKGVLAKRPVANAAWKNLSAQRGTYQSYAKTYTERFSSLSLTPAALGFQGEPEKEWPRVALRFTLSQPGVDCAIVGTTSPENTRRNLQAVEEGPLPSDVVGQIRKAFEAARKDRVWPGLT